MWPGLPVSRGSLAACGGGLRWAPGRGGVGARALSTGDEEGAFSECWPSLSLTGRAAMVASGEQMEVFSFHFSLHPL